MIRLGKTLLLTALIALGGLCFPAQAETDTTLRLMQQLAIARDDVQYARIDSERQALVVKMADGTEQVLFAHNIDLVLAGLASEAERQAELAHFIAQLEQQPLSDGSRLTSDNLRRVFPVVGPPNMFGQEGADFTGEKALFQQDFAAGLSSYLAIDSPDSISYVNLGDLALSGMSEQELTAAALQNLRIKAEAAVVDVVLDEPWVAVVTLDGFYEGSLMLIPEFWNELSTNYGQIGLAYPGRGTVLLFQASDPAATEFMAGLLASEFSDVPYPVSTQMMRWTQHGWVPLHP